MKLSRVLVLCMSACLALQAQEPQVLRVVKDSAGRGTLADQRQLVRGDTGKWSDAPVLRHAPPLVQKPQGMTLDDWMDELAEKETASKAADENWLLFRTRQLDDNDRVWIQKIERRGNVFTVTLHEAIWQGKYFKTFTYYDVQAVNLGKLPRGAYTVVWVVQPLIFKQLEKPREAQNNYQTNWPVDDQLGERKPVELKATFTIK